MNSASLNLIRTRVQSRACVRERAARPPGIRRWLRGPVALLCLGALPAMTGCLNPDFVNATAGNLYPTAPGDEPYLAVRIINDTSADLTFPIAYDDGFGEQYYLIGSGADEDEQTGLSPEARDTGLLLHWPVHRLAIGVLDNPLVPSISASYGEGKSVTAPFGNATLSAGVDYDRGDTVVFHITESSQSSAYITVSVGVIDGSTQEGTFQRGDPYATMTYVIQAFDQGTWSSLFGTGIVPGMQ